ncbi:hypothetical protein TVAG_186230 [Trichomonas vaginalis G3]|uniref:Uncharacterized protein n=1 Tax=Trichomonas vaginalis (strain ATCC PRA-98 / G3) TaxID=412133 RepID=A2D8R6_TRIV3|nr:hypothetical protein TVAG_186230 [Trichomonas vaginalis G3]|eukprot:XP_001584301.1 hypothetical protein [Trichomonas vaginalis G3]
MEKEGNHPLAPCGLYPIYFFTDYYTFPSEYNFSETNIAWKGEIDKLYKNLNDGYTGKSRWMLEGLQSQYFPGEIRNEHFMVWMRPANSPNFKKLFAHTDKTIPKGQFNVSVSCNYLRNNFFGERYVSLIKPGILGGKNKTLFISDFVLCGFCMIGIFVFKGPL